MILLDTHVLVWLADSPHRLTDVALKALPEDGSIAISAVSAQEIAYAAGRGRISFDRPATEWIFDALAEHDVEVLAPDLAVATRAGTLPTADFPGDPADRLIYATALERGIRLISADKRLREFDPARVVW